MTALGTVGTSLQNARGPMPVSAGSVFTGFVAFAGAVRNDGKRGPQPYRAGGVPGTSSDLVPIIVANYGQAGGAVSIF